MSYNSIINNLIHFNREHELLTAELTVVWRGGVYAGLRWLVNSLTCGESPNLKKQDVVKKLREVFSNRNFHRELKNISQEQQGLAKLKQLKKRLCKLQKSFSKGIDGDKMKEEMNLVCEIVKNRIQKMQPATRTWLTVSNSVLAKEIDDVKEHRYGSSSYEIGKTHIIDKSDGLLDRLSVGEKEDDEPVLKITNKNSRTDLKSCLKKKGEGSSTKPPTWKEIRFKLKTNPALHKKNH